MAPRSTRNSQKLSRAPTLETPGESLSTTTTSITSIARKNTMEQTIEESKEWLEPLSIGQKRKRTETDWLHSGEPPAKIVKSPAQKKQKKNPSSRKSKSKSPVRKTRASRKQAGRSLSPTPIAAPLEAASSWSGSTRDAVPTWVFSSGAPAFGLHVESLTGKVWMGNDAGGIFGLLPTGEVEAHMQLNSGVKCLVSDMGQWLYAGCDNGAVYDITHPTRQRLAFKVDSNLTAAPTKERLSRQQMQREAMTAKHLAVCGSGVPKAVRRRHIVFCIDTSASMNGNRIAGAVQNMRMFVTHNMAPEDTMSLITFSRQATVRFQGLSLGRDLQQIEKEILLLPGYVTGQTALYAALLEAYAVLDDGDVDEEQWVVLLTDGADNASGEAFAPAKARCEAHHANLIAVSVDYKPPAQLRKLVEASANGMLLTSSISTSNAPNMAETFKDISQALSSGVLGLAVRDGLLVAADSKGQLGAQQMNGRQGWRVGQDGIEATSGWMLCSDDSGVYHGHTQGVTKVDVTSGQVLWCVQLPSPVMSGCIRDAMLHIAAGQYSYILRCADGGQVSRLAHQLPVSCNAAGDGVDYVGSNSGLLQAMDTGSSPPQILWQCRLPSAHGFALSMQEASGLLFVSTSSGSLLCIDGQSPAEKNRSTKVVAACPPVARVETLKTTAEVGDGILVSCKHALSDDAMRTLSSLLHAENPQDDEIEGECYRVATEADGKRRLRIKALNLVLEAQDPTSSSKYGEMARNGSRVTWCTNSYGGGRWGLVVDDKVLLNGSPLVASPNDGQVVEGVLLDHHPVLLPHELLKAGLAFVVESLDLSPSRVYRVKGDIRLYSQ